ncbi:hypothetical protein COCNU_05G009960 [Cocos nucifera]|uniref:Uncharacterized protein n=1 Tax=Cocos nucifera TaxID=13894 RepID=A0A8K0I949_COCNU|nr:hypothetical protein COCNU_05G009960 [Cocos nucifera]
MNHEHCHHPSFPSPSLAPFPQLAMASTTTPLPAYEEPMPAGPQRGSGSIGPFFAVMSVILVLTVLSCIFGRTCAARAAEPDASYDCMRWRQQRWGRCMSHRNVVREAKAAVAAESNGTKVEGESPMILPMP